MKKKSKKSTEQKTRELTGELRLRQVRGGVTKHDTAKAVIRNIGGD